MEKLPRQVYTNESRRQAVELMTREEAMREISESIDLFYNRQRRQARLGYLSPAAYMQQFVHQQQAA